MQFHGLTELCGPTGIGKTKLSTYFSKDENTIYICSQNIKMSKIVTNKKFLIKQIFYFQDLIFLVKEKLTETIKKEKIKLIIIDSFDHLISYEKIGLKFFKEIKELISFLKKLIFSYELKIILVNNLYDNKFIGQANTLLGLGFFYFLNTRIVLCRIGSDRFIRRTISVDGTKETKKFVICEEGVVISNEDVIY